MSETTKKVIYENVVTYCYGIMKVIKRKSKLEDQILNEVEKYFMGIKYKKQSELRESGIADTIKAVWGVNNA